MDKIIDFLKNLGLSDGESKLYVTLLKSDAINVRELATKTGIKRTTAYLYIDQLIEKGLIMKIVKDSQKLVTATQPKDNLQVLIEKNLTTAKLAQSRLPIILKDIKESMPPIKDTEAEIKYYKGKNGVKKIYEEALSAKELRSYVNFEILRKSLPENEFLFPEGFKKNKDLKMFELLEYSDASKKLLEEFQTTITTKDKFSYKFLPPEVKLSSVDILIFEGKVAVIQVGKQLTGVLLQSTDYFENSKELFNLIWSMLK